MKLIFDICNDDFSQVHEYINDFQSIAEETLRQENKDGFYEVSLSFVNEEEICLLNEEYREKKSVTDVLSFPMYTSGEIDQFDLQNQCLPIQLGDIVVCFNRAQSQAVAFDHSLKRELCFLICHSMLHLLGYDHHLEKERMQMQSKERNILSKLGILRSKEES